MANIEIGGRLHSTATGNVVTGANEVLDDIQNKKQQEINAELIEAVGTGGSVDSRIAAAKAEIKGNATSACDTLGEAEALISAEATRVDTLEEAVENAAFLGANDGSAVIADFDPQSDTVWKKAQTLSAAEKAQVKVNIGVDKDIENLQELYQALTQSDIEVVNAVPASGVANKIYRVVGESSYADYMFNSNALTTPIKMAEYNNAIDDEPTAGSDNLVKSGGVDAVINGKNERYTFSHATENGIFDFHIPAGSYTVASNFADLYIGLNIYFKDAEGTTITSNPMYLYVRDGLQINEDVAKIQLYGSVSTQGTLNIEFTDTIHVNGVKDEIDALKDDFTELGLQKDILLDEGQIVVTGTGQYVNKIILTLEGDEIDNNCWYYFEADSFSGSQSTAPLNIYATINGVRTSVANSRVNPDALCFYNTNGKSITKLEFVLYPLSSGAVFNGVRIYKMVDAVPCNVLDNVATSVVQKEALSRVIPSTTCKTIAHRGWNATAPKCMLSAVLEAKKNLCSIVENDVFNSKDEQLVMWHDTTLRYLVQIQDINGYILYLDPTLMGELTTEYGDELYYNITSPLYWLNPTTNNLYTWNGSQYVSSSVDIATLSIPDVNHLSVKSFNLADLKRFDFGIWKNVKYKGETIPTFEEWVSYCKCIGVDIYIDKKLSDALMAEKIEEMVTIVRRHGMLRNATWLGFYPEVRTYDPKARCIILSAPTSQLVNNEDLLQALEDGGEYSIIFEPEITQLTAENAALALDKGFGLEAYYVEFFPYNTPKRTIFQNMINAINIGCQGLTMDYYTVEDAIYGKYLK